MLSTTARSDRAPGWAKTKLTPPELPDRVVPRTALVSKLRAAGSSRVISVIAPAGYGKTTLLAQWATRERRPFAWVSLEKHDGEARTLFACITSAIGLVAELDPSLAALPRAREPLWTTAVPRLAQALAALPTPIVLVLDDIDHVRSAESIRLLAMLERYLPAQSRIALAGRVAPRGLIARFRTHALLAELDSADLALSLRESRLLLDAIGLRLTDDEVESLAEKTEGWPAGLYLAALSVSDRGGASAAAFGGDDRFVADYLRQEHLSALSPKLRRFLTRSAVLSELSPSLCDYVLERHDSARQLAAIEESSLFLVALDHRRERFRFNHLFRELLLSELMRDEPQIVARLHARAADWAETHDQLPAAIDHADAAGDRERMASLLETSALEIGADTPAAERWFRRLDEAPLLAGHPAIAVLGSRHHALHGRARDANRWAHIAEDGAPGRALSDGSPSEPLLRVLRATRCENGPAQMREDATAALAALRPDSPWQAPALVELGAAALLIGDEAEADTRFAEAAEVAESRSDACTSMVALAERSIVASQRGDYELAGRLAHDARAVAEDNDVKSHALRAIERVASVRVALRSGDAQRVNDDLANATKLAPLLTSAAPWFAAQIYIELARAQLALGAIEAAKPPLHAADEILHDVPDLGVLRSDAESLKARADALSATTRDNAAGLTPAELRLLPYLATHFSFREIGERLFVSRNTVKTQAISVYRKLDVSSRSDAIEQAIERGLVERNTHLTDQRETPGRARAV